MGFAVSGKNPFGIWVCRKSYNRDNRKLWDRTDSLDESELDADNDEDIQDDLEDQTQQLFDLLTKSCKKLSVDRATDIHFEPHKIPANQIPNRWSVGTRPRARQSKEFSRCHCFKNQNYGGINISEKEDLRVDESLFPTVKVIWILISPFLHFMEKALFRLLNENLSPYPCPN